MKDLAREKMWAAERWISWMRIAALGVATAHPAVFGATGSRSVTLSAFLVVAWVYAIWSVLWRPERRIAFLGSAWFATIADAAFITCYVLITGGTQSPWYPHYYIALAMVAYRFGPDETLGGVALFSLAHLLLAFVERSAVGIESATLVDVGFRVILLGLLASVMAPLAGETIAQTRSRIVARDLAGRAEATTAQLRALLMDVGAGIVVLDDAGRVEFANVEAQRLLGSSVEEGADAERVFAAFAETSPVSRLTLSMTSQVLPLASSGGYARVTSSRYGGGHGRVVAIEDVTEEVRAERELRAARFRAEEAERRRIAGELHDEVGEVLTGLHLALDRMAAGASGSADGGSSAEELVDRLMQRVQSLSVDLRPPVLDDLGLLPALVTLVDRFRVQSGISVNLTHRGLGKRLPADVEIAAYRVVQEALTNIARHSGAGSASVRVEVSRGTVILEIEDDGCGLGPGVPRGAGSGLAGMRERVSLLDGSVSVEAASPPRTGTRIRVEIPV